MARNDVRICKWCREEITCVSAGDESWDYCEGCNQTEGDIVTLECKCPEKPCELCKWEEGL